MFQNIFYNLKNYADSTRNFLLDTIFPIECLSCSREGFWICDECYKNIPIKITQECIFCGKTNLLGGFCKKCRGGHDLDGVMVASNYNDKLLSEIIKTYKYKFAKELSKPLSKLLIKTVNNILTDPEKNYFWHQSDKSMIKNFSQSIVIPIPLHNKRKRWRGFNQAEELAKYFSEHYNLELNKKDLVRQKFKKTQTTLDKNKRFYNIKDNFKWIGNDLNQKNIILIDDVSTSTATLNECALVLKKNGAKKVWGLVIAHG